MGKVYRVVRGKRGLKAKVVGLAKREPCGLQSPWSAVLRQSRNPGKQPKKTRSGFCQKLNPCSAELVVGGSK